MEGIVFFFFAAGVLIGALGVVIARNPVHSALFLLMTLSSVAVLFLQLDAALVAAVQIVVYASAIVVLFLFVITLLGVDQHESRDDPHRIQVPTAIVLGVLLAVAILGLVNGHWSTGAHALTAPLDPSRTGNVRALAESLFTSFIFAFEITAVLLVIAVVGGVALARRSGQRPGARTQEGSS